MAEKMKVILGCLSLCLISSIMAANVVMKQNFDTEFNAGVLKGTAKIVGGNYVVQAEEGSIEIVSDAQSAPNALKISRKSMLGYCSFNSLKPINYGNDFKVTFDVKVAKNNNVTVFVGSKGQSPLGGVNIIGGSAVRAYNAKQVWTDSGLSAFPIDKWAKVSINFNGNAKTYDITVTYPDGTAKTSGRDFPFLQKSSVSEVRFLNSLPAGSSYIIDNLVLENCGKSVARTAKNGVVLDQNFDKDFAEGAIAPGSGTHSTGKWILDADKNNYFITTEKVNSKPYALKVMRDGKNGYFALRPFAPIPPNRDYTIEFNVLTPPAAGTVLHMVNDNGIQGGVLVQSAKEVQGYNISMAWESCGKEMPMFPENQWVHVKIKVNVNQAYYTVSITMPDGKVYEGVTQHPFLSKGTLAELRFVNILPQKTFVFVDDVKVSYEDQISMAGRENYSAKSYSNNSDFDKMLKGKGEYKISNEIAELEISPPVKIGALLFEGAKLPKRVTVKARNAGGHWTTIGVDMPIDPKTGLLVFKELDQILKLTLQFKNFTGTSLSALGIYSPVKTPQGELDRAWSKKLDAEYDLPVYDQQYEGCNVANLTFVNHTKSPLTAEIKMHERLKDREFRTFTHIIPVGTSNYVIELDDVPNGEYLTTITDISKNGGGKIIRLLRHCTSPETTAVPRREMTGEKIYFPDAFFLDDCQNIRFTTGVATPRLVKYGSFNSDEWITFGTGMGVDENGNIVVNFKTMNRLWQTASTKNYHAVSSFDDMTNWQINEGTAKNLENKNIFQGDISPSAKPDWGKKRDANGKIKYRYYDKEKDGPINLKQLQCEFISPSAKGTLGYNDYDWNVMRPSPAHVWTVWYKSPGEALIVGRTSLISGFPPVGNLEAPNSGSDLHFGQWLSDDGKTLYFGFGRHLIRYAPYRAEYDNMADRARIVGIWRTTDGINWEQGYVAPPDKSKPKADQHYGGNNIRLPNGAGLRIAILYRYSAYTQQISWEVVYSWDGFRWTRFQREPQFLANGPLGSWYHCGGYVKESALEHNGKSYQLMNWVNDHYHFQSEIVHGSVNKVDHMTGAYMKNRYGVRKLEQWPFFKEHFDNSWDKLAEHTRNARSSVGIMEYRYDGFFFASAGDDEARMLTKVIKAENDLKMNAVIRDGGFIEVSLLDSDGKVIDNYTKRFDSGDDTKWQVFDTLPEEEFQVELKLRNADIYTLNF